MHKSNDIKAHDYCFLQLRVVFDACECDEDGRISLSELANLSRSHTDNQVDQILEIFNISDNNSRDDRIDFHQFCQRMIKFMAHDASEVFNSGNEEDDKDEDEVDQVCDIAEVTNRIQSRSSIGGMNFSPTVSDQGAFNENLKRSFEKTKSSVTSSPNHVGSKLTKRKVSQSKLIGNIPLVNTSSEDEAEDSFDRKIASSLAFARPLELQPPAPAQPPQFLVRGNSLRTTVVRKPRSNPSSPNVSSSSGPRPRPQQSMYPESESSSRSSTSSESSATASPAIQRHSLDRSHTKLALENLERKVEELAGHVEAPHTRDEYDSQSSGVDSLKADLEEEINSSILLARKHGDERLENEKRRHSQQMDSLERERDLERRNYQLRFEQMQEERDKLKQEVVGLKDKVGLLSVEKTLLEEQMMENVRKQADNEVDDVKRKDREEELLNTVKNLSEKVADQDQMLAEVKEDNVLLKKQLKELSLKENKGSGFRIFGNNKENSLNGSVEDPQVNNLVFIIINVVILLLCSRILDADYGWWRNNCQSK